MIEIIPAILPKDYEDMKNRIALVRSIIPIVQIDICDGLFVKNITWPYFSKASESIDFLKNSLDENFRRIINEEEGMPFWEDIDFELDLMVVDAVQNFDIYTKLSPKRIVFHLEAVGNLVEFKNFLEGMDVYVRDAIQIGLAINTTTAIEKIFPLINYVDFIQCMGIEKIGFQEQDFDKRVLTQIKSLKEKFPDLIISVDGGVSFKTAPILLQAGASRLISGSTIFKAEDIREIISELEYLDLN